MKSVSFYTLGCRLNQAETAIIQKGFEQKGYEVVDFTSTSDVVIINTCTVTENGDADTRRLVNKVNRINPHAKIALVGCQAQIQGERLLQLPNVQWVIGNALKMDFANVLEKLSWEIPQVKNPPIKKGYFTIPIAGVDPNHTRANLKIQDGCDFFCTFCEIPYARGRARSRVYDDILRAGRELVDGGHREIVLTGINVGTFKYVNKSLVDVITGLEEIDGLERIRISSIEPTTIPEKILNKMAAQNKLCRYLHIPIQHGEDSVLSAMKRKYTTQEFSDYIYYVYENVPDVCIGTDVMVGFPGETNEQFEKSYGLLKDLPIAYFHVFSYSDRDFNKSRKFDNKVPKNIIDSRSSRMRELSARKRRTYFEQFIGKKESVLFEQKKNGYWTGLTDTYIRVKVKSPINLKNTFATVQLEQVENQTILGTIE
jgi:threonylcarbamoyladenosine tRNA methylthiotransferase MtaB